MLYLCNVIELKRHIEILLLDNDCVIVPGLGGFMAHHVDARYEGAENIFLPPLRTLGFNPRLTMNDSLLVQSYIEAYDISYPEALRRIEAKVAEIRQHLDTEGTYELNGLGTLHLNDDGNLEFEPCEAGILTPTLYGLSSYEFMPLPSEELETTNSDEEARDKVDSPKDDAITIKMSWLRNAIAVAAAAIVFFMISTPVSNNTALDVQQSTFIPLPQYNATQDNEEIGGGSVKVAEETIVSQEESTPSAEAETVAEADATEEKTVADEAKPTYTIVLASQVTQRNAEIFIDQLNQDGITNAKLQTSNKTNMLRVVYGSYSTQEKAIDSLRSLRRQNKQFNDAWVLEVK